MRKDVPDIDSANEPVELTGRIRTDSLMGLSKAPIVAGGVIAAVLIPILFWAGISAASAMTATNPVPDVSVSATSTPTPTPIPTFSPNEESGTDDPLSPPDRDSDQNAVIPQEDEIYYIQDGDTLTALSARFGVSIDYIAAYNAVRDVNVISEGAVLRVPFLYVPPAGSTPGEDVVLGDGVTE